MLLDRMEAGFVENVEYQKLNFIDNFNKTIVSVTSNFNLQTLKDMSRLLHGLPNAVEYVDKAGDHREVLSKIGSLEDRVLALEAELGELYVDLHKQRVNTFIGTMDKGGWKIGREGDATVSMPEEYVSHVKALADQGKMFDLFPVHRHSITRGEDRDGDSIFSF